MRALSTYAYLLAAGTIAVYWFQRETLDSDLALWIAVAIAAGFTALGKGVDLVRRRRIQRRRERSAQVVFEQLSSGSSIPDYVLYLRPFSTTGRLAVANPRRRWLPFLPGYYSQQKQLEFETLLSSALPRHLPLIALGRPGEHIGAGRIRVEDEDWRAAFEQLVTHARWIVMIPSHEGETGWEVQQLIEGGHLQRTVFLMPPQPPPAAGIDLPVYWSAMRAGVKQMALEMPAYNPAGLFFRIGTNGRTTRARYLPRLDASLLQAAFTGITRQLEKVSRSPA